MSLESTLFISSSAWYQFLNIRLTYSFTHHFLVWFTTLLIRNSLSFTPGIKPTCFTNPTPVVSLLPPGLPSRTFARTVSSKLLGFVFYFFLIFVSVPCTSLSWPYRQLLSACKYIVSYDLVHYRYVILIRYRIAKHDAMCYLKLLLFSRPTFCHALITNQYWLIDIYNFQLWAKYATSQECRLYFSGQHKTAVSASNFGTWFGTQCRNDWTKKSSMWWVMQPKVRSRIRRSIRVSGPESRTSQNFCCKGHQRLKPSWIRLKNNKKSITVIITSLLANVAPDRTKVYSAPSGGLAGFQGPPFGGKGNESKETRKREEGRETGKQRNLTMLGIGMNWRQWRSF